MVYCDCVLPVIRIVVARRLGMLLLWAFSSFLLQLDEEVYFTMGRLSVVIVFFPCIRIVVEWRLGVLLLWATFVFLLKLDEEV